MYHAEGRIGHVYGASPPLGTSVHGLTVWTWWTLGHYNQQTPPRNYLFLVVRAVHAVPASIVHTDVIFLEFYNITLQVRAINGTV